MIKAPSQKQIQAYTEADARICIWQGAVRSGKTFSSILKLIERLRDGPAGDVLIVGVTRESIQRNVLSQLSTLLGTTPPPLKTNESRMLGRQLYFVGASDESAARRIQGSTVALAYVDEITNIPRTFWNMLLSRLSIPGAQLLGTCNPEGPTHWLKKEFLDRSEQLNLSGNNLKTWRFQLDDNPALDEQFKNSLKQEYTGMWYARYILGEWAVAQGLIFDGWDNDNVFHDPFPAPIYYIAGCDYGTTNPTCVHIAGVSPRQWPQIRIEDEYYYDSSKAGRSKSDAELADDIKKFISWRPLRAFYVDPAAASLKIELRNRDIPVLDGNNDVLFGIKIVSKFISGKNLVVSHTCRNLIEQMQSYAWDQKAADRGEDKPMKIQDHAVDACRYLCASAFPQADFGHPDEYLTIEQIRHQVYGEAMSPIAAMHGGYF